MLQLKIILKINYNHYFPLIDSHLLCTSGVVDLHENCTCPSRVTILFFSIYLLILLQWSISDFIKTCRSGLFVISSGPAGLPESGMYYFPAIAAPEKCNNGRSCPMGCLRMGKYISIFIPLEPIDTGHCILSSSKKSPALA